MRKELLNLLSTMPECSGIECKGCELNQNIFINGKGLALCVVLSAIETSLKHFMKEEG